MKKYIPELLAAISRYQNYIPTLPPEIKQDLYARMGELIEEEKAYCDMGNYKHMAQILTSVALYKDPRQARAFEAGRDVLPCRRHQLRQSALYRFHPH